MRRLKLIWDFRGPAAGQTAVHHEIHLKEYAFAKALENPITGIENQSDMQSVAFLVVDEAAMPSVRDDLKPHRGQVYSQS